MSSYSVHLSWRHLGAYYNVIPLNVHRDVITIRHQVTSSVYVYTDWWRHQYLCTIHLSVSGLLLVGSLVPWLVVHASFSAGIKFISFLGVLYVPSDQKLFSILWSTVWSFSRKTRWKIFHFRFISQWIFVVLSNFGVEFSVVLSISYANDLIEQTTW